MSRARDAPTRAVCGRTAEDVASFIWRAWSVELDCRGVISRSLAVVVQRTVEAGHLQASSSTRSCSAVEDLLYCQVGHSDLAAVVRIIV
mgnify:CR=1 FL=1